MSSSKQPTQTSQTVTQTNLPAYMEPFVSRLAGRAEESSNRPYEAYTGPRISGFTDDQNQAMIDTRNLGGTWQNQMNQAGNRLSAAGLQARDATNQGMFASRSALANAQGAFGQTQDTMNQTQGFLDQTQGAMGQTQGFLDQSRGTMDQTQRVFDASQDQTTFGNQQAQQYMNPFIQGVVDRARSGALQTLQEQKARANADTQNSAPFGSYGDAVSKSMLERDYANRVSDQEANLLMQGYTNAQDQFQRDRGFGLDAGRFAMDRGNFGLGAGRLALEQGNFGLGAGRFALDRGNFGLDAGRFGLDAGRFGLEAGNFGLRGAEAQGTIAGQQAQMAGQRRGLAAADIDALNRSGLQQQQQRQASLDMAYNDFVNQRDYSDNRLQFMNNILRGLPSQMGSETTSYAPPANPYSQLLGLGGSAVGIAKALGGGGV